MTTLYRLEKVLGSLEVLLALYMQGPCLKSEIARKLRPSPETIFGTLGVLKELKLIEMQRDGRFPFRQKLELTREGRRLVEAPLFQWPSHLLRLQYPGPPGF